MKQKHNCSNRILVIDIIAVFLIAGFAVGYYNICTHSVNVVDESGYIMVAHRFFLGDRPIVDDWQIAQMIGILLLLPFSAFYSATRSTEGVVLFFRILYMVCQLLVTAYLYISLRIYGNRKYRREWERRVFAFGALIAAVVFACFIPACMPSLSYYAASLMGLAVLSVTLFCYPVGKAKYVFCGVVFAAVVLARPEAFLLYLLLTLLLLALRLVNRLFHKRFAQVLYANRFWSFFTIGGCIIAIPLAVFLLKRCGLRPIIDNFPHLFDGVEFVFSQDKQNVLSLNTYRQAIALYGPTSLWLSLILIGLAAVLYRFRRSTRPFFLVGMCVCMTLAYAHAWNAKEGVSFESIILFHGLPLYLCAPIWMLSAIKPDKRICCAWVFCALFSVVFSAASAVAVGWGGIAAGVFSVILITQTGIESINAFIVEKKQRRLLSLLLTGAVAASLFIVTANETQWFIRQNHTFMIENMVRGDLMKENSKGQKLDVMLAAGPLKGVYTDKQVATVYYAIIHDLDTIRANTDPSDYVLVYPLAPFGNLYLDRNYAVYSAWDIKDETDRIELYWKEHPERIPDYIYLSYFDLFTYADLERETVIHLKDILSQYFNFEVTQGEAGEILRLIRDKSTP
ncbi:MAG: hypothetical protein IJK98_06200 [Clostridia bacterium]|nr:hypothetical protein [Clostridia bacterium]